jgi:hypothetical protein
MKILSSLIPFWYHINCLLCGLMCISNDVYHSRIELLKTYTARFVDFHQIIKWFNMTRPAYIVCSPKHWYQQRINNYIINAAAWRVRETPMPWGCYVLLSSSMGTAQAALIQGGPGKLPPVHCRTMCRGTGISPWLRDSSYLSIK